MDFSLCKLKIPPILTEVDACNPIFVYATFKSLLILCLEQCCFLQDGPGIFFISLKNLVVITLTEHYVFKARFSLYGLVIFVQKIREMVFLADGSELIIPRFVNFPLEERNFKKVL